MMAAIQRCLSARPWAQFCCAVGATSCGGHPPWLPASPLHCLALQLRSQGHPPSPGSGTVRRASSFSEGCGSSSSSSNGNGGGGGASKGTRAEAAGGGGGGGCGGRGRVPSPPAAAAEVEEVPVVICGAGPTGLTLSLLLAKCGVRHVVLERASGPTQHPQAHFINNRTMEIFRSLGLAAPVRQLMPPLEQWRRFVYCESVAGRLYGEVDHFQGQSSPLSPRLSPEPVAHLPQHRLLRLMLQRQAAAAAAAAAAADAATAATATAAATTPISVLGADGRLAAPRAHTSGGGGGGGGAVSWGAALRVVGFRRHQLAEDPGGGGSPSDVAVEVEVEVAEAPGCFGTGAAAAPAPALPLKPQPQPQQGGGRRVLLRCQYLVAADGAHSAVRGMMGGKMEGEGALQHLLNAHFTSRALARLASSRPAMLYFVFNPGVVAVLVAHDIEAGEFVAQIPYFPPLQSPADFPPERVVQLIRAAAGQLTGGHASSVGEGPSLEMKSEAVSEQVDVQLLQLRPWTMTAEVADRFAFSQAPGDRGRAHSSGEGNGGGSARSSGGGGVPAPAPAPRVFLVGDSAHRFPPAGGFGMNTGVQDAANLAWKLAAVLRGMAGGELLGSYESERRPIALANTALSVRNWGEATRVPAALGLDPRVANAVNSLVTNAAPLPQWARKGLLEAALDLGRRLAGPQGLPLPLVGSWREQQVQRILGSGASLRLQFPAEDLGFVYDKGAVVVQHPTSGAPTTTPAAAAAARLPPRGAPYNPSSAAGCRLPHCWLHLPSPHLQAPTQHPHPHPPEQPIAASSSSNSSSGSGSGSGAVGISDRGASGEASGRQRSLVVVVSTLDVVADPWVGPRLLLFTDGHLRDGNPWLVAAAQLYDREDSVSEGLSPQQLDQPPAASVTAKRARTAAAAAASGGGPSPPPPLVVVQVMPAPAPATATAESGSRAPANAAPDPKAFVVHEPPEGSVLAAASAAAPPPPRGASAAAVVVRLWEAEPGGWLRTMGLSPGSCLLVRPDGHVAWRRLGAPKGPPPPPPPPPTAGRPAAAVTASGVADDVAVGTDCPPVARGPDAAAVAVARRELRSVLAALHWKLPGS
ncbi:hypothetical protein PLESTB_001702100 [Pleodorina starrii]|uniref:FAD-binding domain-containing protein n=1 Tax=Pleodorina starrii TaxID=330485 RepID=A0A9W6BZ78_9CHLO|nr:hypothetical protein PLESTM_001239800 [Pleodorina starrii]GLC60977.1 hypothetical protein PLESTB_001702100 [Pleodorina starrii]GLC66237.1 hypothetical protein PLESTF_000402400 [Pleodorina starrii]